MYYDNKSTFYIKQYGPAVITIAISLVLVVGGLYIYLSSNKNNRLQDTLVAKNADSQEVISQQDTTVTEKTNSLQEEVQENVATTAEQQVSNNNEVIEQNVPQEKKEEDVNIDINNVNTTSTLSVELKNLKNLQKSSEGTILGVDNDKNIIINISNNNYKATLIGIDYKKSNSNIVEQLNNDLKNKKVKIAFDNVKTEDNKLCIYLYINDELYNKKLLENGLSIIKVEKANTSLLNELVTAQKQAKTNNLGIWQK